MSFTYLIIGFTSLFSIWAFNNPDVLVKFKHWPYYEQKRGEYYRWLTSGFLHGDYNHLIFNMITLLLFGRHVEAVFMEYMGEFGRLAFLLYYLLAIIAPSSATYYKYRGTSSFASIGASGAVSAVLFTAILVAPLNKIGLMFIPVRIPGFIFGALYLWYSDWASRRGGDGIDHTAHFFGAVFGFFFPLIFDPFLLAAFFAQLTAWFASW